MRLLALLSLAATAALLWVTSLEPTWERWVKSWGGAGAVSETDRLDWFENRSM